MPPIKGINKTSLWNTWKIIRKELRNASIRDVIDYVDYDVDPDKWIQRLLAQISEGRYEPSAPFRFTLGKSNGFSRTMTMPTIPDLVLYRMIVDAIYLKAIRREHKHVYFKRERIQQAQAAARQQAVQTLTFTAQYRLTSQRAWYNWLKFAQYRKLLLLNAVHPYLVISDITNFFDSILHSHVEEALRGLSIPPRMVGLLFLLLERLSIRHDYAPSHAISLPVDQFDCSRTLAHLCLFVHDDAMTDLVGEDNYVRWMDDQNFGVDSVASGLRVLSAVGKSLAGLHLSPNTKKSRILNLSDARRHFHLDLNEMLDNADLAEKNARTKTDWRAVSKQIRSIWSTGKQFEGIGEFDKILKRIYRLAGTARLRFLRRRALQDVLANPTLVDWVSDYMRCSGTTGEYLTWVDRVTSHAEQIYPDVNIALVESLLRLEANQQESARIRNLAASFLLGKNRMVGVPDCKALAPLVLLRFGDKRSLPLLLRCFGDQTSSPAAHVLRAGAIVYASFGKAEFWTVRRAASRLLRNHLADVVRLIERIRDYTDVPTRYQARLDLRYDVVARRKYIDTRALLTVRLLHLSNASKVKNWVVAWKAKVLSENISDYDRRLVRRLL